MIMTSYGISGASNEAHNLFDGSGIFGPIQVTNSKVLEGMLKGFDRRAGLDASTWLRQYAKDPAGKDGVYWPNGDSGGFAVDDNGHYISSIKAIPAGTFIDRFGQENDSAYFAPLFTPYAARSLPANVLFQPYNAYEVLKDMSAEQGPIAPGFGQLGRGIQYIVPDHAADSKKSKRQSVESLMAAGYLRRLTTAEIEAKYNELTNK